MTGKALDKQFGGDLQAISVIPDSGTGELAGIDGTMAILIEGGRHLYEFDYRLPHA
jgi:hypothetical protein